MSLPDMSRWRSPEAQYLGVRPDHVADGFARFVVDLPYGDERDEDPSFASCAVAYAADTAALCALFARLDEQKEHPNGTASMHLNLLEAPSSRLTIEATVTVNREAEALIDVAGRADDGRLVLRGLLNFSVRQRTPEAAQ